MLAMQFKKDFKFLTWRLRYLFSLTFRSCKKKVYPKFDGFSMLLGSYVLIIQSPEGLPICCFSVLTKFWWVKVSFTWIWHTIVDLGGHKVDPRAKISILVQILFAQETVTNFQNIQNLKNSFLFKLGPFWAISIFATTIPRFSASIITDSKFFVPTFLYIKNTSVNLIIFVFRNIVSLRFVFH